MSKVTPSLPKGTRDFGPDELRKRNYIFGVIRNVFEKYGFQPIETPVMENLSTLEGKYGEEGDKLLFRILNSGDFLKDVSQDDLNARLLSKISHLISEKGLRYDLTIPFARYVVQHQHEITFPFKRYQIQPVWRADRPQKGRYREFYQCDADVIGSDSLLNEVELILIYDEVFRKLGLDVTIKINHRKIIEGIVSAFGQTDRLSEFITIIDKIDKVGYPEVVDELQKKFISPNPAYPISLNTLSEYKEGVRVGTGYGIQRITSQLETLEVKLTIYDTLRLGVLGVSALNKIVSVLQKEGSLKSRLEIDPFLARGLNYYTGTVFEAAVENPNMTIGGGGRYDNLTGVFGLPDVSGVGISFGVERIYDVMEELKLFNNIDLQSNTTRALFINFGGEAETKSFQYLQKLRANDIPAEIYPSNRKWKKQIGYADKKGIPYAIFVGEEEIKNNTLQIKNLRTGDQAQHNIEEVIELLKK